MNKDQYIAIDDKLDALLESLNKIEEFGGEEFYSSEGMSLSDMAQIAIDEFKQEGLESSEIIERLQTMYGYDGHLASEELERFEKLNNDSFEDATNGEIYDAFVRTFEEYDIEGFPDAETRAFDDISKQYDIDHSILRNIITEEE